MFQTLQNGKSTKDIAENWRNPARNSFWARDKFYTKREAEIFCYHWAAPIPVNEAIANAPEMELDKEYNYSGGIDPVLMMIQEI